MRESSTQVEVIRLHLSKRQKSKYVYPKSKASDAQLFCCAFSGAFIVVAKSSKRESVISFHQRFLFYHLEDATAKMTKNNWIPGELASKYIRIIARFSSLTAVLSFPNRGKLKLLIIIEISNYVIWREQCSRWQLKSLSTKTNCPRDSDRLLRHLSIRFLGLSIEMWAWLISFTSLRLNEC